MEPVYEYKLFGTTISRYVVVGTFSEDTSSFVSIIPILNNNIHTQSHLQYLFEGVVNSHQVISYISHQDLIPLIWQKLQEAEEYVYNRQDIMIDAIAATKHFFYNELLPKVAAEFRKHHASKVITRYWREANSNPYHPICRRRLLREFDQFTEIVPI